jgi:hypothetical protein
LIIEATDMKKAQAEKVLKDWIATEALKKDTYDSPGSRKPRDCVKPNRAKLDEMLAPLRRRDDKEE